MMLRCVEMSHWPLVAIHSREQAISKGVNLCLVMGAVYNRVAMMELSFLAGSHIESTTHGHMLPYSQFV